MMVKPNMQSKKSECWNALDVSKQKCLVWEASQEPSKNMSRSSVLFDLPQHLESMREGQHTSAKRSPSIIKFPSIPQLSDEVPVAFRA